MHDGQLYKTQSILFSPLERVNSPTLQGRRRSRGTLDHIPLPRRIKDKLYINRPKKWNTVRWVQQRQVAGPHMAHERLTDL